MGRAVRALAVLKLGLIVLANGSPAGAKGVTHITIEGPGLTKPILLRQADIQTLTYWSGFYSALASCRRVDSCTPGVPKGNLGPRYVATYVLMMPTRSGGEVRSELVQYLYPNAQPEPLAYLPPGQRYSGGRTTGGTFAISGPLLQHMVGLDDAASPAAPTAVPTQPPVEPSEFPIGIAAALAIMALLIGLFVWRARRVGLIGIRMAR